jgi:diguanylate cyclase (GGDEF)-like protein
VVYVSPCYARKDEARGEDLARNVDVAIDFQELIRALDVLDRGEADGDAPQAGSRRPEPLKEASLTDGFPRSTLTSRDMTAGDVKVVRGVRELDELLTAIESGEAAPLIVDALNCEGCLDGPAVNPHLSLFAKRDIEAAERRSRTKSNVSSREILRHLPALDLRRAFPPAPVRLPEPTAAEIAAALDAGGFDGASLLDCGACGHVGCRDFATAVFRGETDWRACPPSQEQKLVRDVEAAEESATVDPLTGLANRRVFSQRLGEEFARQARYGGQASLLMLDVDTFKGINDRYGHLSGDKVLTMVAETIRATLRSTDVPVRYGGDEFAIILPQTGKTEAFAVAEKVRLAVAHKRVGVSQGDSDPEVGVHVSVGVASSGARVTTPLDLIEAADKALYQAKEHGRNQVRLAPG